MVCKTFSILSQKRYLVRNSAKCFCKISKNFCFHLGRNNYKNRLPHSTVSDLSKSQRTWYHANAHDNETKSGKMYSNHYELAEEIGLGLYWVLFRDSDCRIWSLFYVIWLAHLSYWLFFNVYCRWMHNKWKKYWVLHVKLIHQLAVLQRIVGDEKKSPWFLLVISLLL